MPEEQGQGDASSVDFLGREDVSKLLELIAEGSTDILEALEEPSAGGGEGASHDGFDFVRLMRITETSGSQSYSFGDPFIVESAGRGEVGGIAGDMDDSEAGSSAPSIEFEDSDGGATAGFHSAVEGSQAFVAGRFTVSAPAGVASISVGRRDIAGTSDESPLVLEGEHGTLTITGFNPESGIVTYQYTENGLAANHAAGDGSVFDRFDIVVTDSTGETVSESLDINIIDTAPDANDDSAALGEEAVTAISGNVLDNDSAGADSMTFDGFTGNASASYGSFIHNDDGSWSYRVDPDNADVQALKDNQTLKETFSYTLTDADGDTSSATLTITINGSDDDVPTIEIPDGNEPGGNEPDGNEPDGSDPNGPEVVAGDHSVVEGSGATVTGSMTVAADAGIKQVSLTDQSGKTVDITGASTGPGAPKSVVVEGKHGSVTVTDYDAASGKITYSYTENGERADHSDDATVLDSFALTVTDNEGDSTSANLEINILDTSPAAVADTTETAENTAKTYNVLTNNDGTSDNQGEDGAILTKASVRGGDGVGTVAIASNGEITFTPAGAFEGDAVIDYTITDGDGDKSSSTLTVKVAQDSTPSVPGDGDNPTTQSPTATVDEDGLSGGNAGGSGDVAGEATVVKGELGYRFGDDGAADSNAFQWNLAGLPDDLKTADGREVSFERSTDGHTLTGTVTDSNSEKEPVITITMADEAEGKYKVTLHQALEHAAGDDENDLTFDIGYTVKDADGSEVQGKLSVQIDDDSPVVWESEQALLKSGQTGEVLFDAGADGVGQVVFADPGASTAVIDTNGNPLYLNGEVLYWEKSADGKTLNAVTRPEEGSDGDTAITLTLSDDGSSYSVDLFNTDIDLGSRYSIASGEPVGSDIIYSGQNWGTLYYQFDRPDGDTYKDVLVSGRRNGDGDDGTDFDGINDNDGDSLSFRSSIIDEGETVRYDFVSQLSFSNNQPSWQKHEGVTWFEQGIHVRDGNPSKFNVSIFDYDDAARTSGKPSNERGENNTVIDLDVSAITVYDASGIDVSDQVILTANANGSVTVDGMQDGYRFIVESEVPFEALEIDGTSPPPDYVGGFALGNFSYEPVDRATQGDLKVGLTGADADGDGVTGSLALKADGTPTTPDSDRDPATATPVATVDEDGLTGGNAGGSGDVTGENANTTGSMGYSFGSNGPASSNAFQWNLGDLPDDLKTVDGREVSFERSTDGHTLTGTVTDSNSEKEPVITITLDDEATGDYTVTLHQALEHAAGDDENDLTFDIGYTVTDADGSEVQGKLSVLIDDDTPVVWEAEQAQLKSGQTGEVRFEAGADDIGQVTFSDVMNGTEVTSVNGGTLLTSNGEVLTYQLSDDGKTLEAKAASGGVAFKVSLSADGSTYEVEVIDEGLRAFDDASKEISEGSKHVVREYGTDGSGSGHRFIAFDGADGAADVVASAWTYRGPWASWLRTDGDTQLAAGHDDLTGLDEAVRLDFVDNLRFSDTAPSWDNHRGITHFSQFINAENGTLTDVGIKAIASAPDGTDTSGHPVAVSGHVLELAKSDVRLVNGAGKDITSLVTIEENADGTLNVKNIPADAQLVLTTGEAFEAIEFRGLDGTRPFSVGDFAYSEAEKDPALSLSLAGTDGDGDTADGSLTLSLPDDDQLLVGGGGDDSITGGSGNDVVLGDAGGKHSVLEPAKDYNLSFIVDVSPSMGAVLENGNSRFKVAIEAIRAKLTELADFEGTIHVQIVAFGGKYSPSIAFNDFSPEDMGDVNEFLDSRAIISGTNFEQAFVTATEWMTDVSRSGFNNVAYFMTDGQPNSHNDNGQIGVSDAGNITTYKDVTNALEGYKPLAAISRVEAIGIGDDVGRDFLKIFDNTADGELEMVPIPLESGASVGSTEMLATFDTGDTGRLASIDNWAVETTNGHIAIDRTPVGTYLRVRDSGTGDGSTVATSDAIVLDEPAGANQFYTLSFDYVTDTPNDFEKEGNPSDRFSWSLEMQNEEGDWDVVATSLPISPSGSINSSSTQFMANGLKGGTYRLQFEVENAAGNFFSLLIHDISLDLYSYTDDQLVPAGEVAIVNSAEEFATALEGGASFDQPADLGGDTLDGGAGDDVLFGDQIDPAGVGGEAGSGYAGLVDYLTTQNSGTEPTQKEILAFIKDNYEALSGDSRNDGGQDRIDGGKGNDQLFAGSGDDVLIGGAGDDLLLGGLGSDTFQWNLGDAGSATDPALDVVSDFHVKDAALSMDPEADKLALGDLLNDFDSTSTDPDQSALDSFIFAQEENGDTVLYIKSDGGLDVQHSNADQKITLDGVSMEGQSSEAFLTMLRNNGQLDVE
ncbi:hypothetical protein C6W88_20120 [Halomonas litopenaei]|uniref:VWFA domain-containing protein n=1 Tax=Halomonas litopenaei TaxID=2109328 RepID=A0ABX5ITA0_9GAMM|nr:hypothetical protein C6W88_20120 [Halomonas litopenaei]PTL89406.1 hypothetical protein C6W89_18825 [Halomonas sp. SYSU XM8]